MYPGRHITLTDSGTSALTLALRLTRPTDGRRPLVALPAFACPDIGTAAIGAGYRIVLYDVTPDTLEPDLESLRRCLRAGASHVLAVHLFGRVVNVGRLAEQAAPFGAMVIEDAAQHAGGTLHGVRGGALAAWSILSFGRGKGLNAGGGGALLRPANEPVDAPELSASGTGASLTLLAKAGVAELLSAPSVYALPQAIPALQLGETVYQAPDEPRAISIASASLLIEALDKESQALAARQKNEQRYAEALARVGHVTLEVPSVGSLSGALRFPVRMRPDMAGRLLAFGVARSYPRILSQYPEIAAHCDLLPHSLSGAAELANLLHTLPTHGRVRPHDIEQLITGVTKAR